MAEQCRQELCEYWGGDGRVCLCALFDLLPTGPDDEEDETP